MIIARPLVPADLPAAVDLLHAYDRRWFGRAVLSDAELAAMWDAPDFDPAADGEGWVEDDALVAFGTLDVRGAIEMAVRDDWAGSGLEDALLARWEAEAARRGHAVVRRELPAQDRASRERLESRGWVALRDGWLLELAADAPTPAGPVAPGYEVRALREDDLRATYEVLRAAFAPYGATARAFEEWRAVRLDRPDVVLDHCRAALHDGELVGACLVEDPGVAGAPAWISLVGVSSAHRRRGLAGALLASVIESARDRGVGCVDLYTHADTGARGLYERLGMVVTCSIVEFELDLARAAGSGAG